MATNGSGNSRADVEARTSPEMNGFYTVTDGDTSVTSTLSFRSSPRHESTPTSSSKTSPRGVGIRRPLQPTASDSFIYESYNLLVRDGQVDCSVLAEMMKETLGTQRIPITEAHAARLLEIIGMTTFDFSDYCEIFAGQMMNGEHNPTYLSALNSVLREVVEGVSSEMELLKDRYEQEKFNLRRLLDNNRENLDSLVQQETDREVSLQRDISVYAADNAQLHQRVKALETDLELANQLNASLRRSSQDIVSRGRVSQLDLEVSQSSAVSEQDLEDMRQANEDLRDKFEKLQQQYDALTSEDALLHQRIDELDIANHTLEDNVELLTNQLDLLQRDNNDLLRANASRKESSNNDGFLSGSHKRDSFIDVLPISTLLEADEEVENLKRDIATLTTQLQSAEGERDTISKNFQETKDRLADLDSKLRDALKSNDELEQMLTMVKRENQTVDELLSREKAASQALRAQYESELMQTQARVAALEQEIKSQGTKSSLSVSQLTGERDGLQAKLQALEVQHASDVASLQQKISVATAALASAEDALKALQSDMATSLQASRGECDNLHSQLEQAATDLLNQSTALREARANITRLQEEAIVKDNTTAELTRQIDKLKADLEHTQQSMADLRANNDSLYFTNEDGQRVVSELQQLNTDLRARVLDAQSRLTQLQADHDKLKIQNLSLQSLEKDKASLAAAVQAKDADLAGLRAKLTQAEQDLARLTDQLASGSARDIQWSSTVDDLKGTHQRLQDKLAEANAALKATQAQLQSSVKDLQSAQAKIEDLTAALNESHIEVAHLQEQLCLAQGSSLKTDKLDAELHAQLSHTSHLNTEVQRVRDERDQLKQEVSAALADLQAAHTALAQLQLERDEALKLKAAAESEAARISAEASAAVREAQMETKKNQKESADKIANYLVELSIIKSQLQQSVTTRMRMEQDMEKKLKDFIDSTQKRHQSELEAMDLRVRNSHNNLMVEKKNVDSAEAEISALQKALKGMAAIKQELATTQEDLEAERRKRAEIERRMQSLEDTNRRLRGEKANMTEVLRDRSTELATRGLELQSFKARENSDRYAARSRDANSSSELMDRFETHQPPMTSRTALGQSHERLLHQRQVDLELNRLRQANDDLLQRQHYLASRV